MSTLICELTEDEQEERKLDYEDLQSITMDLSVPISERLKALVSCYQRDSHRALECLSTLVSQYQMSGIKNLENFLHDMCSIIKLPSFFRLEAAKALLEYEELEDEIESDDDEEAIAIIREGNQMIRESNMRHRRVGAAALNSICITMGEMPTPCRVEAICLLMEHSEYKTSANKCFQALINDIIIECDFRYRCILDLEHRGAKWMRMRVTNEFPDKVFVAHIYKLFSVLMEKEFPGFKPGMDNSAFFQVLISHINYKQLLSIFHDHFPSMSHPYEYFIYEAQLSFMSTETNYTSYRILASQYLLQKFVVCDSVRTQIQETLLSFGRDDSMDYNIRADAADVLMQLGDDTAKSRGQELILELGRMDGEVVTLFDNAQNVHTAEVEASVAEVLEFFADVPTLRINDTPIGFAYVQKQVCEMLERKKSIRKGETHKLVPPKETCSYCEITISEETRILSNKKNYCSEECQNAASQEKKITLSLGRIEMDRALYSKYNSTLVNILLKVWSYLIGHEDAEEMQKRLLEELEEMSGTCSSGFASRLINVISGFGNFGVKISWEDQIRANFSGRLNAAARKIRDEGSLFYRRPYLIGMVALWLVEQEKRKDSIGKTSIIANLKKKLNKPNAGVSEIVDEFLSKESSKKINICIESFSNKVLEEMTVSSAKSADRQYFSLFFRSNVAFIREEMYAEFKEFIDDTTFDLYMRKALMHYEGIL